MSEDIFSVGLDMPRGPGELPTFVITIDGRSVVRHFVSEADAAAIRDWLDGLVVVAEAYEAMAAAGLSPHGKEPSTC